MATESKDAALEPREYNKKGKKTILSVSLDSDLVVDLDRFANATGLSRSAALTSQLRQARASELEASSAKLKPLIIVTSSHKGGVAKTTTAGNLAVEFALSGKKTLIIDLDGQGSVSEYLSVFTEDLREPCIADIMFGDEIDEPYTLADVKRPALHKDDDEFFEIPNLEVVPSNLRFDNADSKMKNAMMVGVDIRLRDAINTLVKDTIEAGEAPYEIIIIDCPPRVDLVTTNAIAALEAGNSGSMVIIPVRPDGFSKRGMKSTIQAVEKVARAKQLPVPHWMLLKTIDEPRTNLSRNLEYIVESEFPEATFFETTIEKSTTVMESTQFFMPLAYYAVNSKSRKQYTELAIEVLQRAKEFRLQKAAVEAEELGVELPVDLAGEKEGE